MKFENNIMKNLIFFYFDTVYGFKDMEYIIFPYQRHFKNTHFPFSSYEVMPKTELLESKTLL